MKILTSLTLDKYDTNNYEEIVFDIYFNKDKKNYCFAFEVDEYTQYPLEDLLDQYLLCCTEDCQLNSNIIEVETSNNDKYSLIKLMNFSTILGKEILNVVNEGFEILCLKYGESNCVCNKLDIKVPILAKRNDRSGMKSFDVIYPEKHFVAKFSEYNNIDIDGTIDNIEYILLVDNIAKFVGKYQDKIISIDYTDFR